MNDDQPYEFSADPARIDAARVHDLISRHTYWAKDRPRHVMDAAIAGSRPYGVYRRSTGEQVGFARIVTDGATFAWLADVIVDPDLRGEGIGKLLVAGVVADVEPLGLRRILLATADAHGLYERYGWRPISDDFTWMERPGTGTGPQAGGQDAPTDRAHGPGLDGPGLDGPGANSPGPDAPGPDAPGPDAPGPDAPGAGTPGARTPGARTPRSDVPRSDAPPTDAPHPGEPRADQGSAT
ncbi:GNAT family N-acetyltransferase [Promicromonospora sp. NPDC052451]|uniref:GNAT family N-acetyltransferase n=1 Tax=Promicromonospora sp. NPDC052451 TaxID=3364407 RepID=UPI0037C9E2AF